MRERHSKPTRKPTKTVLGRKAFAAISAVEGLKLDPAGRKRVSAAASTDQRRAEVRRAYLERKKRT